ncbi:MULTISPECIES: hypothetical protein [unclassified Novosphingobium]|uniref:hypothetical protein n=1 Tax=unclassified Novosphingobium TaxID=2644732 RepID=UPI000D4DBFC5|nr:MULTISPECIES: hypothetical protein [unclassified Novosphingobium]PTR06703.1 hypothetical protein C8K11_11972 [Novosphingobium sp. GV055]PUA94996.1 hypothetical protein C8K12_11972 [Novosphingobium sp. GV061]PUB14124.1 hypothetical protein C8K14_11972 [Novosphingobium sp. GV079]PUB38698.1 hypothetical protein C8K10_11972 [Novosphingobium sp. GV027]
MAYAETTTVPFEKSMAEIVGIVRRAGAGQIIQAESDGEFVIQFTLAERQIRFRLPLHTTYSGPAKSGNGRAIDGEKVLEQRNRQRGRALLLVIKAKIESIESGIETVEQAFLANVVTVGNLTVHERIAQSLAEEYRTGLPSSVAGLLGGPAA